MSVTSSLWGTLGQLPLPCLFDWAWRTCSPWVHRCRCLGLGSGLKASSSLASGRAQGPVGSWRGSEIILLLAITFSCQQDRPWYSVFCQLYHVSSGFFPALAILSFLSFGWIWFIPTSREGSRSASVDGGSLSGTSVIHTGVNLNQELGPREKYLCSVPLKSRIRTCKDSCSRVADK